LRSRRCRRPGRAKIERWRCRYPAAGVPGRWVGRHRRASAGGRDTRIDAARGAQHGAAMIVCVQRVDDGISSVAARTRIVSAAGIRLDLRKSVRPFKGIFCHDISEFESYIPSHAVGLCEPCLGCTLLRVIPQRSCRPLYPSLCSRSFAFHQRYRYPPFSDSRNCRDFAPRRVGELRDATALPPEERRPACEQRPASNWRRR
jgi:hypothetical protein